MTPMSMPNELSAGAPPAEPLVVLERWPAEARNHRVQPNPNAMTLTKLTVDSSPSSALTMRLRAS